jgi:hypothetical protein
MHDSDDRMLARYQHLYKKSLKIKAFQLQKIQRAETRELCICVLLKAVAICNNILQETDVKQYEACPEQFLLEKIDK